MKGITPSRMVTPTGPDAHGAEAIPPEAAGDGVASPEPTAPTARAGALTTNGSDAGGGPAPVPVPVPQHPTRGPARRIVAGIAVFLLVAFVIGAAFIPLPYYLFKPGSVRDTEPLIAVEGTDVYPSDGSIGYTTVSLRQATLLGLGQAWIDDDIDVFDRERVLGDRDVDTNRQINLQMMSDSKQIATQVALERLGYEVDTTVGQLVVEVVEGSPAEGEIEVGDVITAIDGETFDDAGDLRRLLADDPPGDTVTATVQTSTGGDGRDVELALAPSPDDPDRGVMGVAVREVVLDYDFPVDIEIDTGDVGGPSAGLAFTLAIIDDLTPGELTGGTDVAVTGTISSDGTVGPVGGTGQKAAAVREAGMSLFLVPADDYEAAVDRAGDDLEVVAVENIDEALEALRQRGGNVDDLPSIGESAAAPAA